ncbi:hypothetical protein, partial [uncultured Dubosiella sp.]|uniref:hypothetical protein n=1 Tax=uncultured Dubosiella sp. TaxID=1937011 RepID=UPI0025B59D2F
ETRKEPRKGHWTPIKHVSNFYFPERSPEAEETKGMGSGSMCKKYWSRKWFGIAQEEKAGRKWSRYRFRVNSRNGPRCSILDFVPSS